MLAIVEDSALGGVHAVMREGGLAEPRSIAAGLPGELRIIEGIAKGWRGRGGNESEQENPNNAE